MSRGEQPTYDKQRCFWCGKIITRCGFGAVSHFRKHVREGLVFEINYRHPEYRGVIEFRNLRHSVKVGTMPKMIIFKEYYKLKNDLKVSFRYDYDGSKWLTGIIDDYNENCIFINLM